MEKGDEEKGEEEKDEESFQQLHRMIRCPFGSPHRSF